MVKSSASNAEINIVDRCLLALVTSANIGLFGRVAENDQAPRFNGLQRKLYAQREGIVFDGPAELHGFRIEAVSRNINGGAAHFLGRTIPPEPEARTRDLINDRGACGRRSWMARPRESKV